MGIFSRKASRERDSGQGPPPPRHQPGDAKRGMSSVLSPDVLIAGDVDATADLRIDGRVEGDVSCKALTQGAGSEIVGRVTADTARLGGAIEGTVRVRMLTVECSARITGNIEYENITIEDGGHIDGWLKHMSLTEPLAVTAADGEAGVPVTRVG